MPAGKVPYRRRNWTVDEIEAAVHSLSHLGVFMTAALLDRNPIAVETMLSRLRTFAKDKYGNWAVTPCDVEDLPYSVRKRWAETLALHRGEGAHRNWTKVEKHRIGAATWASRDTPIDLIRIGEMIDRPPDSIGVYLVRSKRLSMEDLHRRLRAGAMERLPTLIGNMLRRERQLARVAPVRLDAANTQVPRRIRSA